MSSPATPSQYSPFYQQHRQRGNAYGHMGMVGPTPPQYGHRPTIAGFDTTSMLNWAKANKWYLLGGALVLGAGIALATSKH